MDRAILKELTNVMTEIRGKYVGENLQASLIVAYATMRAASLSQDGRWPEPSHTGLLDPEYDDDQ